MYKGLSKKTEKTKIDVSLKNDLLHKLELKEEQLQEVSFVSSNFTVETMIDSNVLTKGEQTKVTVTLTNNGKSKLQHIEASLLIPKNWQHEGESKINQLKPNESKTITFDVTVPAESDIYQPYDEAVIQTNITFKEKGNETAKDYRFR